MCLVSDEVSTIPLSSLVLSRNSMMLLCKLFVLAAWIVQQRQVNSFASSFVVRSLRLPSYKHVNSVTSLGKCTSRTSTKSVTTQISDEDHKALDRDFARLSFPAFVSLAADPIASIVDVMYVAKLGAVQQAAMGIALSAQFSVAKLYNDPLLKTSTSLVAGKEGESLEKAVASAIITAVVIGITQSLIFLVLGRYILRVMGVGAYSEILRPAASYLKWRSLGVPAGTILLVANGIFRGRGDAMTPLYGTLFSTAINAMLDPFFIFTCGMGCAGAGAATAIAQWCTVVPLLFALNRSVSIKVFNRNGAFFREALQSYFKTGGLLFLRTGAKIGTYSVSSAAAARLGTIAMAAHSLSFNLAFASSQLCEAISIASQALLARYFPFSKSGTRKDAARHIIYRSLSVGLVISGALTLLTYLNQHRILSVLTRSPEVRAAVQVVMPMVLATQLFKALEHSTSGILLGGLDWEWSSFGTLRNLIFLPVCSSINTVIGFSHAHFNVCY